MDWFLGALVFFGIVFLGGMAGDWFKHQRLASGIRYGNEPDNLVCNCGRVFEKENS